MSVRVHWDLPTLRTSGRDDASPVPARPRLVDERDEYIDEPIPLRASLDSEDESVNSYTSDFELSTNATESDLVGPGRTLGLLYGRAGRALENGLSKVTHRLRARNRQDARHSLQTVPVGTQNYQRRHTSSIAGSSILRAYTFSTVSSDQTATDFPGAGRLIGKVYMTVGRMLEARMNKIANDAGRGPTACAERIRKAVIGEPYSDDVLMRLHVKISEKWKEKDLLVHEWILFKECRQLLRYAMSPIPSTHNRAMQLISELAVEDRYIRTILNFLDAPRILEEVRKKQLKRHSVDSDWFIPYCRKAVVCLSNNEVNITLFRHLRMAEDPRDLPLPLIYYTLEKYLNDPEQSFLAVRYLRRMVERWRLLSFPFDVASDCIGRLAHLVYSLPHIVEWGCMDAIFKIALQSCLGYIDEHGKIADYNVIKWRKLLIAFLTNAHQLPRTIEFINERSDMKSLLDPTNHHNQWSAKYSDTQTLFLPDGSGFGRQSIRAVASLPQLLLSVGDDGNGETAQSLMVSKYDHFPAFRNLYNHKELESIKSNLSVGPDVITSEIISLRDTDWHSHRGRIDGVPREPTLSFLCRKLADFLESEIPDEVSRTSQNIRLILQLDRYCRNAMIDVLVHLSSSTSSAGTPISFDVPNLPNIDKLEELVPRRWMYRHWTSDGEIHIRSNPPYSEKEPCSICLERGIWEYAVLPDPPDVFCGSQQLILALEVRKGEFFDSRGHIPILAGVNGAGRKEYIAAVMYDDEIKAGPTNIKFHAFTTVTEGASNVTYLDEHGLHSTDHFWVFVLRFDTDQSVERRLIDRGVADITGHCFWMADTPTYRIPFRTL